MIYVKLVQGHPEIQEFPPSTEKIEEYSSKESISTTTEYPCNGTIKIPQNSSWEGFLETCTSTNVFSISPTELVGKTSVTIDLESIKTKIGDRKIEIVIQDITEVNFIGNGRCSEMITFQVSHVNKTHINRALLEDNCVTFDNTSSYIYVNENVATNENHSTALPGYHESTSIDETITSLSVIIAILTLVILVLLFYAFCYKKPTQGHKFKENRTVTIEPAIECMPRQSIVPDMHKQIAEAAKTKVNLRSNSFKCKKVEPEKTLDTVHYENERESAVTESNDHKIIETEVQVHAGNPPPENGQEALEEMLKSAIETEIHECPLIQDEKLDLCDDEPCDKISLKEAPSCGDEMKTQNNDDPPQNVRATVFLNEIQGIALEMACFEGTKPEIADLDKTAVIMKNQNDSNLESESSTEIKHSSRIPVPVHSKHNRTSSNESTKSKTSIGSKSSKK
uniref:CSON010614 protein n=1 Tax=Culicoides sonorensis TaxID=179676 RepID=A0A336KG98_CULSO